MDVDRLVALKITDVRKIYLNWVRFCRDIITKIRLWYWQEESLLLV